jgi:hypothetical protein
MRGESLGRGLGTTGRQSDIYNYRDALKDKRRDELMKMRRERT